MADLSGRIPGCGAVAVPALGAYNFSGNDGFNGNEGNDTIRGGAGGDWMRGGAGNELFFHGGSLQWLGGLQSARILSSRARLP